LNPIPESLPADPASDASAAVLAPAAAAAAAAPAPVAAAAAAAPAPAGNPSAAVGQALTFVSLSETLGFLNMRCGEGLHEEVPDYLQNVFAEFQKMIEMHLNKQAGGVAAAAPRDPHLFPGIPMQPSLTGDAMIASAFGPTACPIRVCEWFLFSTINSPLLSPFISLGGKNAVTLSTYGWICFRNMTCMCPPIDGQCSVTLST
jgi:hypothetical protein